MRKKLTNNWGLKLISVCLAVSMWLIVINESDPVESKTVTVRNVEYRNEDVVIDSGQTFTVEELEGRGISVTVQVRKLDSPKVSGNDFVIIVDLAKMGPYGAVEIDVEWRNPGTYTIDESDISWRTTTVQVTLEDIIERNYSVQLLTSGQPEETYIVGDCTLSPRSVEIKAPASVMERIRSVGIEVDINGLNSEVAGTAPLKYYDVSGNELDLSSENLEDYEFSVSADQIEYTIPLLKTKEVRLSFGTPQGEVADGYRFIEIEGANQTVNIAGLRAVLADIDAIEIPSDLLSVEGASENVVVEIDTAQYVPEGVTVEGESVVTVTLVVEPLVTQIREVLPEQIAIDDAEEGYVYTIRSSASVSIEGLEEDLNALTDDMLDARISVAGLEEGTSTVPVDVTVGTGFTLVDAGEVTVTKERIPETQASEPSTSAPQETEEEEEILRPTAEETTRQTEESTRTTQESTRQPQTAASSGQTAGGGTER